MGAAATQADALDGGPAAGTREALPAKDADVELVAALLALSVAVFGVAQAGASVGHGLG